MYMTPFERHQFEESKKKVVPIAKGVTIPWSTEVLEKARGTHRALTESPLKMWYEEQNKKRRDGLSNEIDTQDICAAAKGFKNDWFQRVINNPDVFKPVIEHREFDWEVIKHVPRHKNT